MKKTLFWAVLLPLLIAGCTKDNGADGEKEEKPKFDYDLAVLHGKWRATHADMDGKGYVDITKPPYSIIIPPTYATFRPDGTYSSEGYLEKWGNGTYTADGKTVTCLSEGKVLAKCDVIALVGAECELFVYENGDPAKGIKIKCRKE